MLKVHAARPEPGEGPPGHVLDDALLVATGAGALRLLKVQRPGRGPMEATALLRGRKVPLGTLLG